MTPWTVAHQAPLSMVFSRQEHWSGLPFLPPGDLPDRGFFTTEPVNHQQFHLKKIRFKQRVPLEKLPWLWPTTPVNTVPTTVNQRQGDPLAIKSPSNTTSNLQNSLSEALPRGRQVSKLTSFDSCKSRVSTLPFNSSHQLLGVTRRSWKSEPLPLGSHGC